MHTCDPVRAAGRKAKCETRENARKGREGKKRHVATVRAVTAAQRAAGIAAKPPGKGLKLPAGVVVPPEGKPVKMPAELLAADGALPVSRSPALSGHDLTTETGRTDMRIAITEALVGGHIGPSEAQVLNQIVSAQKKEASSNSNKRTTQVRFASIETREQAEAYREAQLIRDGLN
jgi:hypothetical protein